MIGELILVLVAILVVWTVLHKITFTRRKAREAEIKTQRDAAEAYRNERRSVAEDTVIRAERQRADRKRAVEEPVRRALRKTSPESTAKLNETFDAIDSLRSAAKQAKPAPRPRPMFPPVNSPVRIDHTDVQSRRRRDEDDSAIFGGIAASSFSTSQSSATSTPSVTPSDNTWSPGGGSSGGGGATVSFGDTSAPTSTPDAPSAPSGD